MKIQPVNEISTDDHAGCFGHYDGMDLLCKRFCALNISCALESDQNYRMEIMEDVNFNGVFMMMQ